MSTEQQHPVTPSSTEDTWGASGSASPPPGGPRRWSSKQLAIAILVAVGITGAGTVAIYAAAGSTSSTQQGPGGGMGGPGGGFSPAYGDYGQAPPNAGGSTQGS